MRPGYALVTVEQGGETYTWEVSQAIAQQIREQLGHPSWVGTGS